jgi:glycosyltransferase involved in cell wall biosynthesis
MELTNPILTIAIPTYNRNEKLVRSIETLSLQLNVQVTVLILDNCSKIPVVDSLGSLLNTNIKVVRNKINLGVSANIIRCFELCDTEWMWLLGDDDPPSDDAVSTILSDIKSNSSCSFLNYKSHMTEKRKNTFFSTGMEEFIRGIDHFGNVLFISLGVYNLKTLQADMRLTYQLSYCLAPHIVYLLSAIKPHTKVAFLASEIHDFSLYNTSSEESWSWISLSLCFPILFEVPLNVTQEAKVIFAEHILTHIKSPRVVYSILEQPKYYDVSISEKKFILRQIFFRSLLVSGLNVSFLSFLYYNAKMSFKYKFVKKHRINKALERDERL